MPGIRSGPGVGRLLGPVGGQTRGTWSWQPGVRLKVTPLLDWCRKKTRVREPATPRKDYLCAARKV